MRTHTSSASTSSSELQQFFATGVRRIFWHDAPDRAISALRLACAFQLQRMRRSERFAGLSPTKVIRASPKMGDAVC